MGLPPYCNHGGSDTSTHVQTKMWWSAPHCTIMDIRFELSDPQNIVALQLRGDTVYAALLCCCPLCSCTTVPVRTLSLSLMHKREGSVSIPIRNGIGLRAAPSIFCRYAEVRGGSKVRLQKWERENQTFVCELFVYTSRNWLFKVTINKAYRNVTVLNLRTNSTMPASLHVREGISSWLQLEFGWSKE